VIAPRHPGQQADQVRVAADDEDRQQLDIAIDWGRYGELFEYDKESGQLVLGSDPAKVGV
jgi:hypothetical protein